MNINQSIPLPMDMGVAAGRVFDQLAAKYDSEFSNSLIGKAQREAVWKVLTRYFKDGDNILELNCGTGVDAMFLAGKGISIFACDASQQMVAKAEQNLRQRSPLLPAVFFHLPTERIRELHPENRFDGAFSNFSGLNCVEDLGSVAYSLSNLVKKGDHLLLCFSTRFCLTEMGYYLLRAQWKKALRRCKGSTVATVGTQQFPVYYPNLQQVRSSFGPDFRLRSCTGIGVAIPPSYLEGWAQKHRKAFQILCRLEKLIATVPILRVTGDHMLLCFEKVSNDD
jgi:ubiquinone/menaquinone biosynthesis C-methylase UbiE